MCRKQHSVVQLLGAAASEQANAPSEMQDEKWRKMVEKYVSKGVDELLGYARITR